MKNSELEKELKFIFKEPIDNFFKNFSDVSIPERVYQKTVMYDNSEGLMQKTNGRIRLRQTGGKVTLSYKLPLPSKIVKKEIEWETKINNWKIGEKLLHVMGFTKTTSYEKYRTTYYFDRVKVDIDEYPFATFIELEGDERNIKKTAIRLGFDLNESLTKPCDILFEEWRAQRGLPPKLHMLFEDYDK